MQNCITRITNGQETVKVLAHFCCNNSISNIESVKKEFIINLDTVYNKPLRYLLKTWIEFIRFRGFCVKKKEWLQWITGIFFSYLVNNRYNRLNDCIDYIILQYIIVLLDNRSFNVQSSCRLFNQMWSVPWASNSPK